MSTPNTTPTPDTPDTPDTPTDATSAITAAPPRDALADEVFVDARRTTALPTTPAPTASAPEQEWIEGPAPFAIILGILGLVVAGAVLLGELTDVSLPWNDLGPWSVVAAGLVVLLVGAIGLRSSRTRS